MKASGQVGNGIGHALHDAAKSDIPLGIKIEKVELSTGDKFSTTVSTASCEIFCDLVRQLGGMLRETRPRSSASSTDEETSRVAKAGLACRDGWTRVSWRVDSRVVKAGLGLDHGDRLAPRPRAACAGSARPGRPRKMSVFSVVTPVLIPGWQRVNPGTLRPWPISVSTGGSGIPRVLRNRCPIPACCRAAKTTCS